MKSNVRLLKADIRDELETLSRIEQDYESIKRFITLSSEEVGSYDRGAIGYLLHNYYNGCENIFRVIVRFFENDLGPQTWHKDLLKRMKIDVPGFRPKVIDEELYTLLDDLRAFRHKFRHSYSFELDWDREKLLMKKFPATAKNVKKQISAFLEKLEALEKEFEVTRNEFIPLSEREKCELESLVDAYFGKTIL